MNLIFSGQTAHLNGLEITPVLVAPSNLKLDGLDLESDPITAALSWDAITDDVQYKVYRQSTGAAKAELLATTDTTTYIDNKVDLGMNYVYTVTAADRTGTESVASNALPVSTIDSSVDKAEIPSGLSLQSINKNDVSFSWTEAAGARAYQIYRAVKQDGHGVCECGWGIRAVGCT
ncbi:hypothetical protein PC115_g25139 [Phytophthora cactorum]|uniref:Fibronectin type-III domain-containing protein n=1 Tax=Phytophthora cactorum TaxID=29920 RepID=A0A8T1A6J4_9STRA|nr:hypothetical protein PC115_g25139 [Phytophthora cactorum]